MTAADETVAAINDVRLSLARIEASLNVSLPALDVRMAESERRLGAHGDRIREVEGLVKVLNDDRATKNRTRAEQWVAAGGVGALASAVIALIK